MLRILRNLLLIALALLIQTSLAFKMSVFGVTPDLVLLVLVYIGISGGQVDGVIFGFLAGFLQDTYAPDHLGINALAKTVVGFVVGYGRGGIVAESYMVQSSIVFGAVLLHDLVYFICYTGRDLPSIVFMLLRYGVGAAFYTTVLSIFLSILLSSIRTRRGVHLDVGRLFSD